jgi:glycosyltransferase involved in cell wall biosynthesis
MRDFSIVMSVFEPWNVAEYALACVNLQKHQNWELIVCYDGEPHDSVLLQVKKISRMCLGRVREIRCSRRPGCWGNPARNEGTHAARGKWIVYVNHDNVIFPDFLSRHFGILSTYHNGNGISVVPIELKAKGRYLGKYPKDPIRVSHIDLMNFAMPTHIAQQVDAFGEKWATTYEADWRLFESASQLLPYKVDQCQTPAGIHF